MKTKLNALQRFRYGMSLKKKKIKIKKRHSSCPVLQVFSVALKNQSFTLSLLQHLAWHLVHNFWWLIDFFLEQTYQIHKTLVWKTTLSKLIYRKDDDDDVWFLSISLWKLKAIDHYLKGKVDSIIKLKGKVDSNIKTVRKKSSVSFSSK